MKTPGEILVKHDFNPTNHLVIEAMKEYAKQWVEEAAMLASTCCANGVDVVNTVMDLRNEIDKQ